jgi:Uma2 family endonuclease
LVLTPLVLPEQLSFSPEQFELVCPANPDAVLELDATGHLISMTPTGGETSCSNSELLFQLQLFAKRSGFWKVFDSSGGFRLPDGSVLSPDASLVAVERWQALSPGERRGFPPLCPDLVVELASPSDEGPRGVSALRRKLAAYQASGARLGWLLLPDERAVEVWPASGGPEFPGLQLQREEIWQD